MNAPVSIVGAVTRGGPAPYKPHAPCPFCQSVPTESARQCGPVWLVGCDDDDCYNNGICAQASGKTADAAWAAWDRRAPQLVLVSSKSDSELAGAGGIK